MGTTLFGVALLIVCIIFIAKDSAAHRMLKLVLPRHQMNQYKRLHLIPGYAIYYLRNWEKRLKATEEAKKSEGESDE